MRPAALVLLLAACQREETSRQREETSATVLDGFDARWVAFNHRLSDLTLQPSGASADVVFIGGTSTTGVVFDDDGTCITDGCRELPVPDRSNLSLAWRTLRSQELVLGATRVEVEVGSDGLTQVVDVPLPRKAKGAASAWIAGLSWSSGVPHGAESCYDPRHGWLPRELGITLADPALSDDRASVEVALNATFVAGLTFEEIRACLDAAAPEARVRLALDVVVAVGDAASQRHEIEQAQTFDEACEGCQVRPDATALAWSPAFAGEARGWSSLLWRFHPADTARGAYLREIGLRLDAESAGGWATNDSRTALSAFDYDFVGIVEERDAEVAVDGWQAAVTELPAEVDPQDGAPTVTRLDGESTP